ncbi:MAG TPA: HAMP domain-containing sensor histidine kinase [Opitutaceae bacterium]|nr:HAMP domain-containing sensor histidine kinase [Opitutaceae bacterium]
MRAILTNKTIDVLAEDRASDFSGQLSGRDVSHCVVREKPRGDFLGVVRVRELAFAPSQRIFADLLSGVPALHVSPKFRPSEIAEWFSRQNSEDAIVLSNHGTFLGLVTRDQVDEWHLQSRASRGTKGPRNKELPAAHLRRELAARTAALDHTLAQLHELSYAVSHEIRTPLRAIRGYAEVLRADYGRRLGETANEHIERIIRASDRLDRLTVAILAYSEIAQTPLKLARVSVEGVVGEAVSALREQGRDRGIEILRPLHDVRADRALLLRCVTELLDNAIKFASPTRRLSIRIGTTRKGAEVMLFIEDNGLGIREDHTRRIFQLFEQVAGAHLGQGTGTGLAVVRKACDRMEATVGVESVAGKGSRFWISLPEAN